MVYTCADYECYNICNIHRGGTTLSKEPSSELSNLLSRKQRQQNMNDLIESLNPDKTEFNTMILGFNDIMQSSFYNLLTTQCKTEKERDEMDKRLNGAVSEVMHVLNQKSLSNPEDMVILTTVMIEAIAKALVRQEDNGLRVSQQIHSLKKQSK